MSVSLLIGNILLIAITVSSPLYRNAARARMLTDSFVNRFEETGRYPMTVRTEGRIRRGLGYSEMKEIRDFSDSLPGLLGIDAVEDVMCRKTVVSNAKSLTIHDGAYTEQRIAVGSLSELDKHAAILSGRMYSDTLTEDGFAEAVISQSAMVELNLLVGEELEFEYLNYADGSHVRIRVTGVFTNSDAEDVYWTDSPDRYDTVMLISPKLFEESFLNVESKTYQINEDRCILLDYTQLTPELVDNAVSISEGMSSEFYGLYTDIPVPDYVTLLKDYRVEAKQISVTLMILQIPVIVLVCAFILMISSQMHDMETGEIALLKSRGATKGKIFLLYFYQSVFVTLVSLVMGIPLGAVICKVLGASSAFMEFKSPRALSMSFTGEVFIYAAAAALVSVLMTLIPAMRRDKSSIVAAKRRRSRSEKPLWMKLYLDVIFTAVSLYGYYSFNLRRDEILLNVTSGKPLEPLLYLSSSLFMVGVSMLAIRLHGYLVRLIYRIGKKKWSPALYTSFLQIIRTGGRQTSIMLFLILTVSLGLFNTTVARTILENAEKNSNYLMAADIITKEYWRNNSAIAAGNPDVELSFTEPDYGKFGGIEGVKNYTRVFRTDKAVVRADSSKYTGTLLAIETDGFGRVTGLDDSLLPYDYYDYLNVLSRNRSAVLLSSNYRDQLGFRVGDKISCNLSDYSETITFTIYGFFDYWPSYSPTGVKVLSDGSTMMVDNYLMVAHLSKVQDKIGVFPYEIWIDMDGNTDGFYQFVSDRGLRITKLSDAPEACEKISSDPLFTGTSGVLTMSFVTILAVCSIGYVIYWTLSIRSRELQLGIFRAMGMRRGEIILMLANEQLLTGGFGIIYGLLAGFAASRLFVPIIQIAYSARDRVLPIELITRTSDVFRLIGVIAAVFIICFAILYRQTRRMKISQALKLGED